jgi:ubiquinone/menaquinone biosynthesis C-methylase UbiE
MKGEYEFSSFVKKYYKERFDEHGPTPQGVDWNGSESQNLRFQVMFDMVSNQFSNDTRLLDYGCGYGELARFLHKNLYSGTYIGYDLVSDSISFAKQKYIRQENISFLNHLDGNTKYDFIFASGVFNIYPGDSKEWLSSYVRICLLEMLGLSDVIIVNFLKPNPTRLTPKLFFPSQAEVESVLPDNFHITNVSDDYGLWEWTAILERKELTR